jgi:hypothetical protein
MRTSRINHLGNAVHTRGKVTAGGCGVAVILLLFVALPVLSYMFAHGTADTVTATVTDKDRISVGSGEDLSHMYLVFTDTETFQNSDSLWYGKFDSSDMHGRLRVGQRYTFKVYGWRIPFFSAYRNIVAAEEQP